MIKRVPEHESLSSSWTQIDKFSYQVGFDKCKQLWLRQVEANSDNVLIIAHAASFFHLSDPRLSARLYRQAIALDSEEPNWLRNLARVLRRSGRKNIPRLKEALVALQEALRKTKDPKFKRFLYDDLAELAFELGEWFLAKTFAAKSVRQAYKYGKDWSSGNAIHNGNCVLGRMALKNGEMNAARRYLKNASKTEGSPQLNSFGPNMRFAQEMLRAGERDSVIKYLEECKRFWKGRNEELSECILRIELGRSPRLPRVR